MRLSKTDRWHPEGVDSNYGTGRPEFGQTVAYERAAWIVAHVRVDDPSEDEAKKIAAYRPEYRDARLPYSVTLRRIYGPRHERENSRQEIGLGVRAAAHWRFPVYDEGRVPLCSCCADPWPCLMADAKKDSEAAARVLDERIARAGVGICYGCGEVITQRQESTTYPEGNVDLPGYPPPRFHMRKACRGERMSYERRRATAYPEAAVTSDEGLL